MTVTAHDICYNSIIIQEMRLFEKEFFVKIAAIIAEYNPLHRGHMYHIEQTRQRTGCEGFIVLLSGCFVQRGEPAIYDKWARARRALEAGAHVVLELPATYAVASAERFARGAVSILHGLGCVQHLSFGCETDDLPALEAAAAILAQEPPEYRAVLHRELDTGRSFPAARAVALERTLGFPAPTGPNATLAIEYIKALLQLQSQIIPLPILRQGTGYHDETASTGAFPSALAVREAMARGEETGCALHGCTPVFPEALSPLALYCLRTMPIEALSQLPGVSEGLEYRLFAAARRTATLDALLAMAKSKRYTMSRLKRAAVCAVLGITSERNAQINALPPYARVLGIRKSHAHVLSHICRSASIPVLTSPAGFDHPGMALDAAASDIYGVLAGFPAGRDYVERLITV